MTGGCLMRRFALAFLAVPFSLLLAVGPVAADTSPNGSNFSSFASSCSTSGGRQVCADTNLSCHRTRMDHPASRAWKSSRTRAGAKRSRHLRRDSGAPRAARSPSGRICRSSSTRRQIALDECGRRTCTSSRTVTVSASDSPTGPISSDDHPLHDQVRSLHDQDDDDGSIRGPGRLAHDRRHDGCDQTGFVDVFTSTSVTHCR